MFSRSFLRCLMNNMTRGNTYLHSSAQRCVQRLAAFADKAKAVPGMQVLIQDTKCHAIWAALYSITAVLGQHPIYGLPDYVLGYCVVTFCASDQ